MSVTVDQRIEPRSLEGALNAAREAIAAGRLHQATSIADAALRDGLVHTLFYNLKAHALEEQGRFDEAIIYLQRALEISPNDPQLLHGVGMCFFKQERLIEAMIGFEAALVNLPNFAPSLHFIGVCLEILGEDEDAARYYQRAVDADPLYADPVAGLASLAARRGRTEDARTLAAKAFNLDPDNVGAASATVAADLKDGLGRDAEIRLRTLLGRSDLTITDRSALASLLGDALDQQDRREEAFAAYVKAKADHLRASADQLKDKPNARSSAEWTTEGLNGLKRWPKAPPEPPRGDGPSTHVFLVGFPRSGTTLLEQVLAAHPNVVTMDERPILDAPAATYVFREDGFAKLIDLDGDALSQARDDYWRNVSELVDLDISGKTFIDKLPLNTLKLALIARLFPKAKILFARRDPRDVVWSCFRRNFRMNAGMAELTSPERAARFYDSVMRLAEAARAKLPLSEHVLRYEALVEDFDGRSKAVVDFLGLDWREEMRDFAEQAAKRPLRSPSASQVRKGLYQEGVGQWRRYAQQLQPILPILQPWVEAFGYPNE
jgi:tetratricopeptide (TPR) repeat protein